MCLLRCHELLPCVIFQVDHIIPVNKGSKSLPENLQILCRKRKQGDLFTVCKTVMHLFFSYI